MHIIHRGIVNKNCKENCLKSFRASFKRKYGIETDIHATKDNKFICFHDFTLRRIFKINKSIKNINYVDLKNIKSQKFKIPLLREVLELSKNKFPILKEHNNWSGKNTFLTILKKIESTIDDKLIMEYTSYKRCKLCNMYHNTKKIYIYKNILWEDSLKHYIKIHNIKLLN